MDTAQFSTKNYFSGSLTMNTWQWWLIYFALCIGTQIWDSWQETPTEYPFDWYKIIKNSLIAASVLTFFDYFLD